MQENPSATGAPPRTPLMSLHRSHRLPGWWVLEVVGFWGGGSQPPPQNPASLISKPPFIYEMFATPNEMPEEAIWRHIMQENPSAAAPPKKPTPFGPRLSCLHSKISSDAAGSIDSVLVLSCVKMIAFYRQTFYTIVLFL